MTTWKYMGCGIGQWGAARWETKEIRLFFFCRYSIPGGPCFSVQPRHPAHPSNVYEDLRADAVPDDMTPIFKWAEETGAKMLAKLAVQLL